MRKKIISNALILSTLFLSGCSTINSTAHKLGVNFWSHELQKAPCKFASTASDISYLECIGEKIPQILEILSCSQILAKQFAPLQRGSTPCQPSRSEI